MELVTGGELQGPLNHNQAGLRSAMAVSQRARKWRFVRSRSFAGMVIDSAFAHFFCTLGAKKPSHGKPSRGGFLRRIRPAGT